MGIEPLLPTGLTGPARDDDRRTSAASFTCCNRVCDGAIVRVNAAITRPHTIASIVGPSADGGAQFEALAKLGKDSVALSLDSTSVKAHRCASGRKGGGTIRKSAARRLSRRIVSRGAKPVIPNKSNRIVIHRFNKRAYKSRKVIERSFCRLKDFRRIATRYDKLARNFLAAVHLAARVAYWLN